MYLTGACYIQTPFFYYSIVDSNLHTISAGSISLFENIFKDGLDATLHCAFGHEKRNSPTKALVLWFHA